jgi:phage terminase small subunit
MAKKSEKVRESLLQQLKTKGAEHAHFVGLVDDYCWYYDQVEVMKADIETRGLSYKSISSTGKEYEKDNPNIKLLPTYTRQMLQILKDLGISTDNIPAEEEDEL